MGWISSVLKQRVISGVILAPIFIALILFAPVDLIEAVLSLVICLAAYEWAKLSSLKSKAALVLYPLFLVCLIYIGRHYSSSINLYAWIYWLAFIWWLDVVLMLVLVQRSKVKLKFGCLLKLVMGVMTLVPMWYAFSHLYAHYRLGAEIALFIIMLVWAADIGAYFAGRSLGRTKLASLISPGKTIEGVMGGVLAVMFFALLAAVYFDHKGVSLVYFVLVSIVSALVSIAGDLFESLLKRQVGVKDSGNLIPGHGGLLDRIDSLTAAVPVFVLGYSYLVV